MVSDSCAVAEQVISMYPEALQRGQRADLPRYLFMTELVASPGARILDLGSGIGAFPLICQRTGMEFTAVDDFGDAVNRTPESDAVLSLFDQAGVRVISADGVTFVPPDETVDVVCTFDSLEHWHHSPRPTLERCVDCLRPGGRLVVGVPNAVDLENRLRVILGKNNMARWSAYWEPETFRSHVREWVVADLHAMARSLGLAVVAIHGRNWEMPRVAARVLDRLPPSLSGTIYLVAEKR